MHTVIGPILIKDGCYTFDMWTSEEGLSPGYAYRRVGDAYYARNAEISSRSRGRGLGPAIACSTLDEFTAVLAEREAAFDAVISNFEEAVGPHIRRKELPRRLAETEVR